MDFIPAKKILSHWSDGNQWFGTNYTLNLYRGCSHGCIYCDSRSNCYGISDFDNVRGKENGISLLRQELNTKKKIGIIGFGSMSDPYNPMERKYTLTKQALIEVKNNGFGVGIFTKSALVLRDIPILVENKRFAPTFVGLTITTASDEISRQIEPNVCTSSVRFDTLKQLIQANIYTGILLGPILPFILDNPRNIYEIVEKAADYGAKFIHPFYGVTLRDNQRIYYLDEVEKQYPGMKKTYIQQFGTSYFCSAHNFPTIKKSFEKACDKAHILYNMSDIIKGIKHNYTYDQLSFM